MKKGLAFLAPLAIVFSFCAPAFSQQNEKSIEVVTIDNFDTPDQNEWTWNIQASRFISDGEGEEGGTKYPLVNYFKGISESLRTFVKEGDPEPQVLGAKVKYDRKGDNWFEVYPEKDGEPYEIPFRGNVTTLDFWVWGSNYMYFMDILLRDAEGVVHVIPAGNTKFYGWKNVVLNIPSNLRQKSSYHSVGDKALGLVGFRFRADPDEHSDDFTVFLDKLQYTAAGIVHVYDGYDLRYADFGDNAAINEGKTTGEGQ